MATVEAIAHATKTHLEGLGYSVAVQKPPPATLLVFDAQKMLGYLDFMDNYTEFYGVEPHITGKYSEELHLEYADPAYFDKLEEVVRRWAS